MKGCSRCHLVSYCGRDCQRSDWAKHKVSCKLNSNTTVEFKTVNDHQGRGNADDEESDQTVIQGLGYIFDVLTGAEQETAIAEVIAKTKEQRRANHVSGDLYGLAGNSLFLYSVYVKMKHFTDAEIEINRCGRYIEKLEKLVAADPVAHHYPDLEQFRVSVEWNRLTVETALLTAANESELHDVEQMPIRPERRESTYAVIKKLLWEQSNSLKIRNLHQCFKVDMHCICLLRDIDNEEAGNVAKTQKLFKDRMAHAQAMVVEHGSELDKESVEMVKSLQWILDLQESL